MKPNFEKTGSKISFTDHYGDYKTFMEISRDPIYRTILSAFEDLKTKDLAFVNVTANVENTVFESELSFTKSNLDILSEVLNPYFENIEEYETCAKVMKLLSELQNH